MMVPRLAILVNRLVFENLKHRPVRTLLSAVAIGVQVTMVLTLVGVSRGMLNDFANRSRGIGADILVRAPGSSLIGFSTNFSEKYLDVIRRQTHVRAVAGALIQPIGGVDSITGIKLQDFDAVSGGFRYLEGGPFQAPKDIIIDDVYARAKNLHAGKTIELLNSTWRVAGVVQSGKLSRMFAQMDVLGEMFANTGKVTAAYVKLDDPKQTGPVIIQLKNTLKDFPIYSMEEFVSLVSIDSVPTLRNFIWVIVTLGVLIGFLVVFLSMYTAVLERTREIGILKALGASPAYVLGILLRETALLAVIGSILGILFSYATRFLINIMVPTMSQAIVPDWWPIASAIALGASLLGAAYPGLKAARQDAIEALAYD
jgi:putative ABC transport system permease protein